MIPAQVRECVKGNSSFTYGLDNAVGRLAKKLPVGDLKAQAASLPGSATVYVEGGGEGASVEELDADDLT